MRPFALDVRDEVLKYLKNNLNAELQAIDSRYLVWPKNQIRNFSSFVESKNIPELVILMGGSNAGEQFQTSIEDISETYPISIEITLKEANQETLQKILFSYEEGIKKILHGINLPGLTFIYFQNYQIGTFIDERRGGSFDGAVLNFSIRIN